MSPSRMDLYRLALVGPAKAACEEFAAAHPESVITSGRRRREDQARAMAENIVASTRKWIERTYKRSPVRDALQKWVNDHPEAVFVAEFEKGLLSVMDAHSSNELRALSKHLSGEAFDVQPVDGPMGDEMLRNLRAIVTKHGGELLEREGGLRRWHAQF